MPVPLGVAVFIAALQRAIVGWVVRTAQGLGLRWFVANTATAVGTGWAIGNPKEWEEFRRSWADCIAGLALKFCGLNLDKEKPLSDASLCKAIGEKTGIELRTLKDRDSIRKDIEHWGLAKLEEQTGLYIRDIHDQEKTRKDLMKFATPTVVQATGLPITDLSDAAKVKEDVGEYLEDRALVMLSENLGLARATVQNAFDTVGTSINTIIEKIEKKGGYTADGRPAIKVDLQLITLGVLSRALLNADRRRREKEGALAGVGRRQEQLRAGLKRFREKHGSRMTYERVT